MLLLTSTSDVVRVISGSAGALDVHASWVDNLAGSVTPGRTNTASITTATTTTVVGSPAASTQRNVRHLVVSNGSASVSNMVTIEHFDGTNAETLWRGLLLPSEFVSFDETGEWNLFSTDGAGRATPARTIYSHSTSSQAPAAADVYITGSYIKFPVAPKVGTNYKCKFDIVKTAAGTATPIITVRYGTAGTTADTARHTLTYAAQTAVADTGTFEVTVVVRTAGATGITQARGEMSHLLATTGLSTGAGGIQSTSAAFDLTSSGLGMGISFSGGTSFSGTIQLVEAELTNIV